MAMTRHFVATGYVVKDGRTLLLHHKKLKMWLPPGGHLDDGELPEEALLREILEETGLDAEIVSPRRAPDPSDGVVRYLHVPSHVQLEDIPGDPPHQHVDLIYFCRVRNGAAALALEGHRLRWCSPEELASDPAIKDEVRITGTQAIEYVTMWSAGPVRRTVLGTVAALCLLLQPGLASDSRRRLSDADRAHLTRIFSIATEHALTGPQEPWPPDCALWDERRRCVVRTRACIAGVRAYGVTEDGGGLMLQSCPSPQHQAIMRRRASRQDGEAGKGLVGRTYCGDGLVGIGFLADGRALCAKPLRRISQCMRNMSCTGFRADIPFFGVEAAVPRRYLD